MENTHKVLATLADPMARLAEDPTSKILFWTPMNMEVDSDPIQIDGG